MILSRICPLIPVLLAGCLAVAACSQATPTPLPSLASQPTEAPVSQLSEQVAPADSATDETDWHPVQSFSGKGSKTTSVFHISGAKWRIAWTVNYEKAKYAVFDILVYSKDNPGMPLKKISGLGGNFNNITHIYQGKGDYYLIVVAANLSNWTIEVEDHATTEPVASPVRITYINYKGHAPVQTRVLGFSMLEPDEYVEIKNLSYSPQNITRWILKNITKGGPEFVFPTFKPCSCSWYDSWQECIENCYPPPPCIIEPYQKIRVYTGEVHPESGGFCFHYPPGNIWDNRKPDVAVLYDANGVEASRKSYFIPTEDSGEK